MFPGSLALSFHPLTLAKQVPQKPLPWVFCQDAHQKTKPHLDLAAKGRGGETMCLRVSAPGPRPSNERMLSYRPESLVPQEAGQLHVHSGNETLKKQVINLKSK